MRPLSNVTTSWPGEHYARALCLASRKLPIEFDMLLNCSLMNELGLQLDLACIQGCCCEAAFSESDAMGTLSVSITSYAAAPCSRSFLFEQD